VAALCARWPGLARASGTSLCEAAKALETAKQIEAQPEVAQAVRAGELSRQQAGLVAGAVANNPGSAPQLLELARSASMRELADEPLRARSAGQGGEARRQALHASWALRNYTTTHGAFNLHARASAEQGAMVMAALPGFGTTTAEAVRDMIATGGPVLKAIVTEGKKVLGVVHMRRRPNAYQKSALDWLFPTCAANGCGTRACCLEKDHREDWARTHITMLELLDRLCRYHHRLKTTKGWALAEGSGKRDFVPPGDPRHPRFGKRPKGPGAGVDGGEVAGVDGDVVADGHNAGGKTLGPQGARGGARVERNNLGRILGEIPP
jgi:hypothetical protein